MCIHRLFPLLLIASTILPLQARAIVNAEDLDLNIDGNGVAGKMDASLNGSSGNSNKLGAEATGRIIWQHDRHLEMLVGSYSYGKSRSVRNTNKAFVHFRHRYAWSDTWALEGFAQAQQDEFSRLKLRTLVGGGLRWSYQRQHWAFHIGLGSFYEQEKLRSTANNNPPATRLWRANSYLALRYKINKRIRLQNTIYYQPAWKDRADYRLIDDAAVHIALADNLDLKLVVEIAQDSSPPAGIKRSDISYKTGLSFHF